MIIGVDNKIKHTHKTNNKNNNKTKSHTDFSAINKVKHILYENTHHTHPSSQCTFNVLPHKNENSQKPRRDPKRLGQNVVHIYINLL